MALVPVLTNKDIQEIGHRIECCRKSVGLSKQEMADNIGLGYEQYRRIERIALFYIKEHFDSRLWNLEQS